VTRLLVLGSGSKGNAFVVLEGEAALLVDAGFGAKALVRRAVEAGVDPGLLRGIVLSHEHGDHARGAPRLAGQFGLPLLCSRGTWRALGRPPGVAHHALRPARSVTFGAFRIEAVPTTHDAAEPLALCVETGTVRIAFATDIGRATAGVRYLLRQAQAVVLESNYDEVMLRTGRYPPSVQQRIAGSRGHLSNRAAADLLSEVYHARLGVVVLAHLSQECNSPRRAREIVEPALRARGFRGTLWVAEQDRPLAAISVGAGPDPDQGELALQADAAWGGRSGSG
jgi:phosphoribosyl 1,2-cyclic phosphodiesterase